MIDILLPLVRDSKVTAARSSASDIKVDVELAVRALLRLLVHAARALCTIYVAVMVEMVHCITVIGRRLQQCLVQAMIGFQCRHV